MEREINIRRRQNDANDRNGSNSISGSTDSGTTVKAVDEHQQQQWIIEMKRFFYVLTLHTNKPRPEDVSQLKKSHYTPNNRKKEGKKT